MDKVKQAVLNSGTIAENMTVIVGLSGGPDSLTLFHILAELKDDLGLRLVPVHVNHKLREKADSEQEHIEKICREMGFECNSFEVDCVKLAEEMKVSLEEAGRAARYSVFSQLADAVSKGIEEEGGDPENVAIAVAHNADDQSETVMFRILRGTGLRGLAGIRPLRFDEDEHLIIRPLLDVPRCDIEDYIRRHDLEPNMDETNEETEATRNKIRLELFPYIEKNINSNVKENLRRLAEAALIDDDYLTQAADAVYAEAAEADTAHDSIILHIEAVADQHAAIIRRVVANIFIDFGIEQELSLAIINTVIEVMFSENPSARADLPGGLVCERRYGDLIFSLRDSLPHSAAPSDIKLTTQVMKRSEYEREMSAQGIGASVYAAFDFDKFSKVYGGRAGEIALRTRSSGDYVGMARGKRKKLQDFFVDSKVPRTRRDELPLVAIGSEVLWILPSELFPTKALRSKGKYSQNYQITDTTKEVLFLEIIRSV